MDDSEMEELLYRLDERTMRIEQRMQRDLAELEEMASDNREDIDEVESLAQRNNTMIKGAGGAIATGGTAIVGFFAKLVGIIKL